MTIDLPGRLRADDGAEDFEPALPAMPPLPIIEWSKSKLSAPQLLETTAGTLPDADVVLITWASAEWAAMHHVFCASDSSLKYADGSPSTLAGWQKFDWSLVSREIGYWGYYRLVGVGATKVLLFKSNVHLDESNGQANLEAMVDALVSGTHCSLVLSIGTAGGTVTTDNVGTVRAVSAGTLYGQGNPSSWPKYSSSWTANSPLSSASSFSSLLMPIPTTAADLNELCRQFNSHHSSTYSLSELAPGGLCLGTLSPQVHDQTGGAASLLTATTFVVGTTKGELSDYTCIEMDDAVIGAACDRLKIKFGFIRNVSDPVQNAVLPTPIQRTWGSTIYQTDGLYTRYNGALAALASIS